MSSLKLGRLTMGVALALMLAGCDSATGNSSPNSALAIVCTTGQVGDVVRNIGGPYVRVQTLMGPGVDPHYYTATPSDIRKLKAAEALFYNGLHLEGRMTDLMKSLARSKPTFAVIDQVLESEPERLRETPDFAGNYDPHVWFDVSLWARCAEYVVERLCELIPEHADTFRQRGDDYIAELDDLHEWCKLRLAEVPAGQRVMVTAHDAFGYLGRAYGMEVRGLQGISTEDEADLKTINRLVNLLVERRVKAVFVETSVAPKNIQSLIQGSAARDHTVVIGGQLFSDAMGEAETPEGTYVGMIRYNIDTIVEALQ